MNSNEKKKKKKKNRINKIEGQGINCIYLHIYANICKQFASNRI